MRQLTDSSGSLLLAQTFDPYGNLYVQTLAQSWAGETSFGFTGEMTDDNGLIYLRARYYNPVTGSFTQRDPFGGVAGVPLSLNPYLYAHGAPVMYTDPSGEFPVLIALAIIGAVALGGIAYGYQVHTNIQAGMDFVDAAYYKNINWGLVGGAAVVGAIVVPAAYACLMSGGWCAYAWEVADFIDDVSTIAAASSDPEAQAQLHAMHVLMLYPDLPINFLASKADDIAAAVKHADEMENLAMLTDDLSVGGGNAARRVLVLGEGEGFEYAKALAREHPDWLVVGTSYGKSNTQIIKERDGNLILLEDVNAFGLRKGRYTGSQRFTDIVFNGPETKVPSEHHPTYRAKRLVFRTLASSRRVLIPGGTVRFGAGGGMPSVPGLQEFWKRGYPSGYTVSRMRYLDDLEFGVFYIPRRTTGQRLREPPADMLDEMFWYLFRWDG